MEKIGYIKKSDLILRDGINPISTLDNTNIQYGFRNLIEERLDVIQPVCAGVILTQDNKILTFKKHKKATSKNSPERDKTLLYIGGHLDLEDSEESTHATLVNGLKREIIEELGLEIKDTAISKPIITYTPSTDKSARHFGIIYPITIEKAIDLNFSDGTCEFISLEDLANTPNLGGWSKLIVNLLIRNKNFEMQE
jgi:predicted NUDIX family phosphoesterase